MCYDKSGPQNSDVPTFAGVAISWDFVYVTIPDKMRN